MNPNKPSIFCFWKFRTAPLMSTLPLKPVLFTACHHLAAGSEGPPRPAGKIRPPVQASHISCGLQELRGAGAGAPATVARAATTARPVGTLSNAERPPAACARRRPTERETPLLSRRPLPRRRRMGGREGRGRKGWSEPAQKRQRRRGSAAVSARPQSRELRAAAPVEGTGHTRDGKSNS